MKELSLKVNNIILWIIFGLLCFIKHRKLRRNSIKISATPLKKTLLFLKHYIGFLFLPMYITSEYFTVLTVWISQTVTREGQRTEFGYPLHFISQSFDTVVGQSEKMLPVKFMPQFIFLQYVIDSEFDYISFYISVTLIFILILIVAFIGVYIINRLIEIVNSTLKD